MFGQKRLLVSDTCLDVMFAFHIREGCASTGIGEIPELGDGLALKARRPEIRERVVAWIVVVLVVSDVCADREHGTRADQPRPGRCDVKGSDLRALVGRAHRQAIGSDAAIAYDNPVPGRRKLGIKGIRSLEPRTREAQIHVNRVRLRELEVKPIEDIFLVPLVMHHRELWWIEEPAAVQSVGGDEVSPVLPAVSEIESEIGAAERAVGACDVPVRRGHALSGAGRDVDYDAGFVTEFSRRRSVDHLEGLDGVHRNLIGENLALLVRNWLAVERKRVLGVVAQAMEETV